MAAPLVAAPVRWWERTMKPASIVASIVLVIIGLGAAAYWDAAREASSALADFAREQASLAREVAASLRVASSESPGTLEAAHDAFAPIEEPGTVVALLRRPGARCLLLGSGGEICMPRLSEALAHTGCVVEAAARSEPCSFQLSHDESTQLGLPPRMGMAGLAAFTRLDGTRWEVAVVATAARERDRERRAAARVVWSFLVSSALVLAFGTLALRKQRRELALAAELALNDAVRALDERLVRADKLATMGALATGIAHEVATPLQVIVGRAEQLTPKVQGDERAARSVTAILEQAARIGEVIRAFLTLARGGTPSLEHTDPKDLARTAVDLVSHRFTQVGVNVALSTDSPGEPVSDVACDRRLLEQALVNLLLNACDACEPGGHVTLEVILEDRAVAFVVTDDGTGISLEAAARATEPFFTTKPEGQGTGLGLAIAREIVQHHRGSLTVVSRRGARGTEARVTIPAAESTRPS
jgi:two-component system NtrC family sensor kinase